MTRKAESKPVKQQKKEVREAQHVYTQIRREIKSGNQAHHQNIKFAKKQYHYIKKNDTKIKTGDNHSPVEKSNSKAAKQNYKNIKRYEKQQIRSNKKILRTNWRKLFAMKAETQRLKTVGVIMAVLVFVAIFTAILSLLLSPLGILFADDAEDASSYSISSAMRIINGEFEQKLREIELKNQSDRVSISNEGCQYTLANWQDVFAVWDVLQVGQTTTAVIDEVQLNNVRTVVWDMVSISSELKEEEEEVTRKDEEGKVSSVSNTVKVLYITVDYKSVDDMALQYSFDAEKTKQLEELMCTPDFLALFRDASIDAAGGTGTPIAGSGKFIYPTPSRTISAGYPNYSSGKYHGGVDFPVPAGTNVFAADAGTVVTVRKLDYSYGHYIIIDHGNGFQTLYAHNSKILVKEGQRVEQGDIIALSGSTGNSTGPHCHFEVRINGNRVNPLDYL